MFCVLETGGKQYKVSNGECFNVEKLDANVNDVIDVKVLMLVDGDKIETGNPYLTKVAKCEVVKQGKEAKVIVIRYKAKKNVRKRQGHRQPYTTLKLVEIA